MTSPAPPAESSRLHEPAAATTSRRWLVPAALALVLVALLGGLLLGRGMTAAGVERVTDPVSLGFVRDMRTHHAQAVRMSEIAHRRSADPEIGYLAFDILSTLQGQIGIITGWLDLWQQTQSGAAEPMGWMGHGGPMPGMASDAEIAELEALPVSEMEEQWLRLMIRHHLGALPMAEAAAERAHSPQVAGFAAKMSTGQSSEVDLMQRLLVERGFEPEDGTAEPEDGTAEPHAGTGQEAGSGQEAGPAASSEPSHGSH